MEKITLKLLKPVKQKMSNTKNEIHFCLDSRKLYTVKNCLDFSRKILLKSQEISGTFEQYFLLVYGERYILLNFDRIFFTVQLLMVAKFDRQSRQRGEEDRDF